MNYRFLSGALSDLDEAVQFYSKASPRVAAEFLKEVESAIGRIQKQPEAWTRISANHRRCRMRRFPYGVIYSIRGEEILISAVFHLHRTPGSWEKE